MNYLDRPLNSLLYVLRSALTVGPRVSILLTAIGLFTASPAWAEVWQVNRVLSANTELELENLGTQAETIAQTELERGFAQASVSEVRAMFSGEWAGQVVPLLSLTVTRVQWQKSPRASAWAKRFGGGESLLIANRSPSSRLANSKPVSSVVPSPNPLRDNLTEIESNYYKR